MRGNELSRYVASERGDGSVVLMCGLSLLLVAFFAVLNSISVKDERKARLALGSFIGSLGILPGGTIPAQGKNFLINSAPILDADHELASKGISQEAIHDLIRATHGRKWIKVVTIKKSNEGLHITLADQGFFAPGTAQLQPEYFSLLDKISALILDSSCDVLIKGHTDNVPLTSPQSGSNWELSARRAMNILNYFVRKGIPLSRMEAAGYGEYHPLFPNDTPEHRALNRRVEIQLVQNEKMLMSSPAAGGEVNIHGFLFKMRNLMGK